MGIEKLPIRLLELLMLTLIFLSIGAGPAFTTPLDSPCPQCRADFAIYDPPSTDEPDGVWSEEVSAIEALLTHSGWSSRRIGYREINEGTLGRGEGRSYRAIIAPGGLAYYRDLQVDARGDQKLREFLESGGGYIGFCAGAYWAAGNVVVAINSSGNGGKANLESDYTAYPYTLRLFAGDAKGPLGWFPWDNGSNVNFELARIDTANPVMKRIGMPAQTRFLYGGGPFFSNLFPAPAGLEIWARAVAPTSAARKLSGADAPMVIRFRLGEGNVVLFGYHPDILVRDSRDRMTLAPLDEEKIEWKLGSQTFEEINLASWNLVHAALQVGAGASVTRLETLPSR
jgi:glutamine amidotransferase-like uncharacterized protein